MRNSTLAGTALAMALVGVVGCAPPIQPKPAARPLPPDPEIERKKQAAKEQERIVMDEVARTHPVLMATLDRDLARLRVELGKSPRRINEVRRDMRLGPPLREACRQRWREGIAELVGRGAKCLGDTQCEACVQSFVGSTGGSPAGTSPSQRPASQVRPQP